LPNSDEEYQNSIANAIMNQQKQFVVGSVIAENFEENPSTVPEHGPRRRRNAEKSAKSLEDNEIDRDEGLANLKREEESSTAKVEEIPAEVSSELPVEATESNVETSSQYPTYNIENQQNNIFNLFRRIIDMKLRLGLNFLQNATVAFQHYLKGVEQRVNSSALFNPYVKNETESTQASRNAHRN
jgi:hypothetical protein